MINVFILFFSIFSFSLSQVIDHQSDETVFSNIPLSLEIYTDYGSNQIKSFYIFYRSNNQDIYVKKELNKLSDYYYGFTIPSDFLNGQYIEYYFLMELNDGSFISYPKNDPHDMPISVRIDNVKRSEQIHKSYLDADYNILSPLPGQEVVNKNLVISLSYFRMRNVDVTLSKIYIDDIDMTLGANIRSSNILLMPSKLSNGNHEVKVILFSTDGVQFNPIIWSFTVVDDRYFNRKISFKGRFWNDYNDNNVEDANFSSNSTNFHFQMNNEWIDIKAKLKKSSLENKFDQTKDRYSLDINLNDLFRINVGDFYPTFNQFLIRGNRVRGVGFKFESKIFELDIIDGELARAIQGDPSNNAVITSDYSSNNICTDPVVANGNITWIDSDPNPGNHYCVDNSTGQTLANVSESQCKSNCRQSYDSYYVDISRNNYTFKRDIHGLRLGLGFQDRIELGFNILKIKDDKESVNKDVLNSIISLSSDVEALQIFNSDKFIDLDGDGIHNGSEPITMDYNGNNAWNDALTLPSNYYSGNLITLTESIIITDCSDYCLSVASTPPCNDNTTYNSIQYVWDVQVQYENLQSTLIDSQQYQIQNNSNNECTDISTQSECDAISYCEWVGNGCAPTASNIVNQAQTLQNINYLDEQWGGAQPKDNLVLGTDFLLANKKKTFKFKSSFALSLYNDNTWNEGISNSMLDRQDGYEDCYIGRTYDFNRGNGLTNEQIQCLDWNDQCQLIPDPADFNCVAALSGLVNIDEFVLDKGTSVNDIPDLEDFSDEIILTLDNLPFPYIINEFMQNGDKAKIELKDITNSPDVAYAFDFTLKSKRHSYNFGLKQVGESFHSLANPYIQTNIREHYFIDRIKLLQNKLFMILKWNEFISGFISDNQSTTTKYDVNASYYPGIDLPSFTMNFGKYYRESGSKSDGFVNATSGQVEGDYDNRISTVTDNYNISIMHRFNFIYKHDISVNYFSSDKKDELYDARIFDSSGNLDSLYVSPKSNSNNISLGLKTDYDTKWRSNFQYSRSYFDYAQLTSSFYQVQRISSLSAGFSYRTDNFIDRIGAGLDYSKGTGNSRYNQVGVKIFAKLNFKYNIDLDLHYNYKRKNIKTQDKYNNSLFKANLSYRF